MSRAGSVLIRPAVEQARRLVFPKFRTMLKVRRATLGDDAGLVGAAYAAYNDR